MRQNKRLNLKNSPPYLQGILLDTQDHVNLMFAKCTIDQLKGSEYLNVFVLKFVLHCKRTAKLFKDARELMENEHSDWRRELNKVLACAIVAFSCLSQWLQSGCLPCVML